MCPHPRDCSGLRLASLARTVPAASQPARLVEQGGFSHCVRFQAYEALTRLRPLGMSLFGKERARTVFA
jgi:hypothetical protein